MKLAAFLLTTSLCFGGDLRGRFQTASLDVQTDSTVNQSPDLPGLGKVEHVVSISIITTDYATQQFCVSALVELQSGEKGGVNRCVDKSPTDSPVALQFSTGSDRPVRWLRLLVTRMKAEAADQLVNTYRH